MTITPPQRIVKLYEVLSTENVPPCTRTEHPFGFHDAWPADMADGEFIVIELSDGSSRVATNDVGHLMLLGQLHVLSGARADLTFKRYRCQPLAAA